MNAANERTLQLLGWTFFIISALFFIIASLRSGDWFSLLGSLFFLFANIIFLIPIISKSNKL